MYILLLILFMSEPRPLTIVVDNSRNSKMIQRDFTYDWSVLSNDRTKRFDEIQKKLKPRITFIDVTSLDSKVLKYRNDKYPYFLYGERGREIEYLPDESFLMASFPLLSTETYLNQIEFDYTTYQKLCNEAEDNAGNEYEKWLANNKPEELQMFIQLFYQEEFYQLPTYREYFKKFNNIKGIPVFLPKYPSRPRIWYPWEKEYQLFDSTEKYERPEDENRP